MEETATEHGVRSSQVKDVADSMFEFVVEVMVDGDRKGLNFAEIRLMKWGVFKVKEGRKRHFERLRDERNKRTDRGE
jgi:preprotein translocase subunit SecB